MTASTCANCSTNSTNAPRRSGRYTGKRTRQKSHEPRELYQDVSKISGGKDAVSFLFLELAQEKKTSDGYKQAYEGWSPLCNLIQSDRLTSFAIGSIPGNYIHETLLEFLKRYVEHNRPMLESAKATDDERIRQSSQERVRRYKESNQL